MLNKKILPLSELCKLISINKIKPTFDGDDILVDMDIKEENQNIFINEKELYNIGYRRLIITGGNKNHILSIYDHNGQFSYEEEYLKIINHSNFRQVIKLCFLKKYYYEYT